MVEDELSEFSGVGAIAGPILPLGMSPEHPKAKKKKKKSKTTLGESLSGVPVGDEDFTFHNHFRYSNNEDSYDAEEHNQFYDAINLAALAFANSENPFGKQRKSGVAKAMRYLKGELKYPHLA